MKVVIIEDEPLTAEDLASCINDIRKDCQIVATLTSVKEATAYFSQPSEADLIFSDIQLGDGLSFEIFNSFTPRVPVIFCTAHDDYAMQAFKANGIDYVLKPVNKKNIQQAIEKYERLAGNSLQINPALANLLEQFRSKLGGNETAKSSSLLIHHKDKIIPVKIDDIAVFFIRNEITYAIDFSGKSYPIRETLEDIEQFASPLLFRANRQCIINRRSVKDATQHFARKLLVNLTVSFQEQISISKERVPLFLKWLEKN